MKYYFLIDYESIKNQQYNGLEGIQELAEQDTVIMLLQDENQSVEFRTLQKLKKTRASVEYRFLPDASQEVLGYVCSYLIGKYSQKGNAVFLITSSCRCLDYLKKFMQEEKSPAKAASFQNLAGALSEMKKTEQTNTASPPKISGSSSELKKSEKDSGVSAELEKALNQFYLVGSGVINKKDLYQIIENSGDVHPSYARKGYILQKLQSRYGDLLANKIFNIIQLHL